MDQHNGAFFSQKKNLIMIHTIDMAIGMSNFDNFDIV